MATSGFRSSQIERMLRDFAQAYGIRSITLRYFNAAGADPDGETGEWHNPETHLIPLVLDAVLGRRPTVTVFGDNYDTVDGTCIRDYIHVTDLATAHLQALEALDGVQQTRAYNLGNGAGFSVKEVVQTAREVTGLWIPVNMGLRRPGDPPELVANATMIQNELGWKPQYADLRTILETAWRWHRRLPH